MPTMADLTTTEFTKLLDDYYKPVEQRRKLSEQEVREIADKLNQRINVPIINETKEEKILVKVIIKVDNYLYDHLPNEFYDLVRSTENGIDNDEAKRLITRLSKLANTKLDIPYLPETAEYIAIRFIIGIVINAARRTYNLSKASKEAFKMHIPTSKEPTDSELKEVMI